MRAKRLFRAIGDVDGDLIEMANGEVARKRPAIKRIALRWGAVAACLALAVGIGVWQLRPQAVPQIEQGISAARAFSAPTGPRKMLNWGGQRYEFVDDGAPYDFSAFELAAPLGTLEYDILAGMQGAGNPNAVLDGATTWALGGSVYQIPGYDPAFRLAVEQDGTWYLAQLVANADDTPLAADYFFRVADLKARTEEIGILPHMGGESLHTFGDRERAAMLDLLSRAEPAALADTQYEVLARAQSEGRSWQLSLHLDDGTGINLYVVPEMSLVSIGDSYYTLPAEFADRFGEVFAGLPQQSPMPAY